jgi:hypothetical protein
MTRHLVNLAAVLCVVFILGAHWAAAGVPVPADFAVRAQFFPGAGSSWMIPEEAAKLPKPWTVKISADGKASQATTFVTDPRNSLPMLMRPGKGEPPVSAEEMRAVDPPRLKRLHIRPERLQQIVQAIRAAEFFTLPRELSSPFGEHTASIVLEIMMDGRTRQVAFEWPNERFDRARLLRFWSVWSAITRAVPSPNHNDELDYWTEAVGLRLPKQI